MTERRMNLEKGGKVSVDSHVHMMGPSALDAHQSHSEKNLLCFDMEVARPRVVLMSKIP